MSLDTIRSHVSQIAGYKTPNTITRYAGGVKEIHPFITGYWLLLWDVLPADIFGQASQQQIKKWFTTTAEGFTPPTRTLNKADVPGQGGLGASFVTSQALNRTFTTTHREYSDLKITNMISLWTQAIDQEFGVNTEPTEGDAGNRFTAKNYKGSCYIGFLKPTVNESDKKIIVEDIEYLYWFDGVWPENDPTDALNTDIAGNDTVTISSTWNFDGWPKTLASHNDLATSFVTTLGSMTYGDVHSS
jgi:hypothetical protein